MTVTLELPQEIESRLVAEARAKGVSLADVVTAHLIGNDPPSAESIRKTPEEWGHELDRMFDDVAVPTGISEGAFHRENWYR